MKEQLNQLANSINPQTFLVGVIFVIAAVVVYIFPPKKINDFYGYRTSGSKKSQEAWDFSQRYSAIKMIQMGFLLVASSFVNTVFPMSQKTSVIVGTTLIILSCVYLIWSTEKAIKKQFPNE
ncbi:MAG: hypothetical protein RIT03_1799 [Bacteroidota bacterium]|jgi:uncharacterized membrane protein